jgi:hypothetical protein
MAEVVATVVANIAIEAGASYATALVAAQFVVDYGLLIGGLAYSASQQKDAGEAARNQYNAAQVDRLRTVASGVAPRELVMGRVRKSGAVMFKGATGPNSQQFYLALALAAHEIDAIETIYLNDVAVELDGTGVVTSAPYVDQPILTGQTTTGGPYIGPPIQGSIRPIYTGGGDNPFVESGQEWYQYWGPVIRHVTIYKHLGVPGQAVDGALQQAFPAAWLSSFTAEGVAYVVAALDYSETAFPNGIPALSAVIRGAKLYDPRTTLTAWSENPALMMRHVYTHPKFGKSTVSAAEDARFVAAANACDTNVLWQSFTFPIFGSPVTANFNAPLFAAGIVAPFGTAPKNLFDDLSQAMGGSWAFAGGELSLKAGTYTAPVMSLTDADLAVVQRNGAAESQVPIEIVAHKERAQKFNTVKAVIWDKGQDYKESPLPPLVGAALLARDGKELAQEIRMAAVNYAPQAQHVAGILMRDARDPLTIKLPFKMRAYPLELFDTVDLTLSRYGFVNKTFELRDREWAGPGVLMLTLKETDAAITTRDALFPVAGLAPNTSLPTPWEVEDVGPLTITSGTAELVALGDGTVQARMRVAWPLIADQAVRDAGEIEVQYRKSSNTVGEWQTVRVAGDLTQAVISGVVDGEFYLVRARARTVLAVGDWSLQEQHLVLGKTEPPPDVTVFTVDGERLAWAEVAAADLAGYRLRFNYGNNTWWDSAQELFAGLVTSNPVTLLTPLAGAVTFLIKAVDTSGNESAHAASIITDLGGVVVANLFLSWPQAPLFTGGIVTGGSVSAGALVANGTDLFYGPDTEPFYGPDTDPFYAAGTFAEMAYVFDVFPSSPGTLYLDHAVAASSFAVEFQRANQAAFYGAGADLFYGPDAEPFYGEPSAWSVWPGGLTISQAETVTFRITTVGGPTQGVITTATPKLDVPDVLERLDNIVIAPGGTRLPITKTYRHAIENVMLTVQTDGNGGISARVEDKNATLGPLVTVRNDAGTAVAGLLDATLQGY